jgi:hypothetical protein
MEELASLPEDTPVVVDMSAIFRKQCLIYTMASIVYGGTTSCSMSCSINTRKEVHAAMYRKAVVSCTSVDPEALFHAMNTGGDKEIQEWKSFSANCLLIATHRYLVYKKPFPVRLEGDTSLLLATRNR